MELKKIFKGGAYIISILLLANLVEALIPIPPQYNPFASSDWITLLWHSAVAVLLAAATGYFTGLLAHFIYMIDDGQFDADDKKKAYEHSYTAFFVSLGILLAASLFGASEFKTALIFNSFIVLIMGALVFVLPKIFGRGIDQGGTASLGVHSHTNQAPAPPPTQTQQAGNQNTTPKVGTPTFAVAMIIFFVIVILARIFGNHTQQGSTQSNQPNQQSNQQQQTNPSANAPAQQAGPHSKLLGR